MARIVAVTACPTGVAHTFLAAEALKKIAATLGHTLRVETGGAQGARDVLTAEEIAAADVVIVAADVHVDVGRFAGKRLVATSTSEAIRKTRAVIEGAVAEAAEVAEPAPAEPAPAVLPPVAARRRLVAVTACPTGIAHTFMAAEALRKAAEALGHELHVETQGSVGARNLLTAEQIRDADAVVLAADAYVDPARFAGKRLYQTTTKAALHDGQAVLRAALAAPAAQAPVAGRPQPRAAAGAGAAGPYRHLMTGVSYMLPLVVAGGLLIALGFAVGGLDAGKDPSSLAGRLMEIGAGNAFVLFVPVLAGFIAYSIAERPGVAPGLIGGMLATRVGAGFLGGIVAGFLAGYVTRFLNDKIKLPQHLQGLKPVLVLPLLSTLIVGLLMSYAIGPPVSLVLAALTGWLTGMQDASALVLGTLLGAMMAIDMGGPLNKSAYTFAVGLLSAKITGPMAAVMAAGMVPPLGLALAATLWKDRFSDEERDARGAAFVLGCAFITEGAIPYAARDPLRVIPCLAAGAAVTGALSMWLGVKLLVPHGGVFVLLIPHAVTGLVPYLGAIVAGTVVSAVALGAAKKRVTSVAASM